MPGPSHGWQTPQGGSLAHDLPQQGQSILHTVPTLAVSPDLLQGRLVKTRFQPLHGVLHPHAILFIAMACDVPCSGCIALRYYSLINDFFLNLPDVKLGVKRLSIYFRTGL